MTDFAWPAIDELIPHKGKMSFLDTVIDDREGSVRVSVEIAADHILLVPGFGVPGWAGFEMMAQAVAAYDGLKRRRVEQAPSLGFLVACRRYACSLDWFRPGERFELEAHPLMDDNETMMFESKLRRPNGSEVATAQLMVYQPSDPAAFLAQA